MKDLVFGICIAMLLFAAGVVGFVKFIIWSSTDNGRFLVKMPNEQFEAVKVINYGHQHVWCRKADGTEIDVYGTFTLQRIQSVN